MSGKAIHDQGGKFKGNAGGGAPGRFSRDREASVSGNFPLKRIKVHDSGTIPLKKIPRTVK
jgi:hypothetical protein